MKNESRAYDLDEIKSSAAASIENGAVTSDYSLNVERACENLNEALASEIMCVLRYREHQVAAKGMNYPQVSAEFKEHADQEEKHMMMLAKRIQDLGGRPDFHPANVVRKSATEFGSATVLRGMIQEDLVAERIAIQIYRKLIPWFGDADTTTRRMLEDILTDEEEHASDLADLLADTKEELGKPIETEKISFLASNSTH